MGWHLHDWSAWKTFEKIEWTKVINNRVWFQHFQSRSCLACGKEQIRSVRT